MTQTSQHQLKSSTDVSAPVPSEAQLQRRPFPHEVEAKDQKTAAPAPISADWQAQQEKVARARFNPDRISLYPVDPVKDEQKGKAIQKKSENASEQIENTVQGQPEQKVEEEKNKLIQKKSEETAEQKSEENDPSIQKKYDSTAEEKAEEKDKLIQKKTDTTADEKSEAEPVQKKSESSVEPEEEKSNPLQRKAEATPLEEPEKRDDALPNKQVQTKLTVGKVGDRYEQEADQVAARVMTMPDPTRNRIQRQPEESDTNIQPKSLATTITPLVQRQSEDEVQTKAGQGRNAQEQSVNAEFENRLANNKMGGSPLPEDVRSFMEPRFGTDLSHVRVHTGADSTQMNKDVRAQAFTYRNHIFYGAGKSPGKDDLTAHELTHVIQQVGGKLKKEVRRSALPSRRESPDENESIQPKSLDSKATDAENNKLTPAESSIQRHNISKISPQIQGNWWRDRAGDVGNAIRGGAEFVGDVATGDIEGAKRRLLNSVADFASRMPGYSLLTVVLGKDPIKDEPVARNATNLVEGILELVPGGDRLFKNLQESGVLQKAFDWFEKELKRLNLTWNAIKALFRRAIDSLSPSDIFDPMGQIEELANIFRDPIQRITRFALNVGEKVMEFVFEGAMALAGKGGADRVLEILKKVKSTFVQIIKDPIGFIGNLIDSVKGGFQKFSSNIVQHLKSGLMGWLFGTLSGAGLQMPQRLDLKGMLAIALQVAGATYQKLRKKLVKRLGEKKVSQVEQAFQLLRSIASGGLIAAWQQISQSVGDVKEMVLSEVRNWVITTIIRQAVIKLVSMFNPAGAVVQAVIAVYNTIMFFVERMQQIMELASAVFNSIQSIAAGKIGAAIKFVEQSMAKSLPVIISFMARLLGLGGISNKIRNIIKRVQKPIDRAMNRIIDIVMKFAKKLKSKTSKNKNSNDVKEEVHKELNNKLPKQITDKNKFETIIKSTYEKYKKKGLKSLDTKKVSAKSGKFQVVATASPGRVVASTSVPLRFTPRDLQDAMFNTVTLYASVNGQPIPKPFKNGREMHAETRLINYLNRVWGNLTSKHFGQNMLTVQITSSPCGRNSNNCASNLLSFTRSKNALLVLQTLGVYKGIFHGSSVDALEDLHQNDVVLETWDENQAITQLRARYRNQITPEMENLVRRKVRETQIAFRLFE